jgi:exodeoxyribonuclease VII large subunit
MFRTAVQRQPQVLQHLKQGAEVIVHGRLTFFEQRGQLQVSADYVQPQGVGLRQAQFDRLRLRLEEEGLFDAARKRKLPHFPRRIGVVTSETGAVFHDIQNVLGRRWPLAELVLAPTPVQGPDAVAGVVAALARLNAEPGIDVIIVARGGGSAEELWTFNEEPVARAVFASIIPVVSGVGHETDTTICDFVADVRAPTPSAAAELVAPDRALLGRQVDNRILHALGYLQNLAARDRRSVETALSRSLRAVPDPGRLTQRTADLDRRAHAAITRQEASFRERLDGFDRQLVALDPKATLRRGYAVVHSGDHVVSSIAAVDTGDPLVIRVADGGFPARVGGVMRKRRRALPPAEGEGEAAETEANGTKAASRGVQTALLV